jgi:DHA2 family multidrug resistance protein
VFTDRNFVVCTLVGFFLGVLLYGPMSMLPQMLEGLMGYSTMSVGMTMAPRGAGVLFAMVVLNRIIANFDYRILMVAGMLCNSFAMYQMSHFSLQADNWIIITSGFIQGMGSTIIFVPLSVLAFATLAPHYRNEAAAMMTLIRNLGGAIGIALIQAMTIANAATVRSRLAEGVRPDNPVVGSSMPGLDLTLPDSAGAAYGEIARQAMMVSYVDAFHLLFIVAMIGTLSALLLNTPRQRA